MGVSVGARIRTIRKEAGFSQEQMAKMLKIPRTAVSMIERGKREVSSKEIVVISRAFLVSADYLLGLAEKHEVIVVSKGVKKTEKKEECILVQPKNMEKFKQVLLYILERCAGRPNVCETMLYKLLYFADFNYYEQYEEHMTGATYKKFRYGPAPCEFSSVVSEMVENNEIEISKTEYYGKPQKRYIPKAKAQLNMLKAGEKDVLDKTIALMADWNATEISNYSHEDMPWKATEENETIDYELVFHRNKPYSVREYEDEEIE